MSYHFMGKTRRSIAHQKRSLILAAIITAVAISFVLPAQRTDPSPMPKQPPAIRATPKLGLLPTPPPAAPAKARKPFGMALGDTLPGLSNTDLQSELTDIADMGVTWVRIDVSWADVQPTNDSAYDWSSLDRVITTAKNYHLQVLGTIAYTPAWAAINTCVDKTSQKCAPSSDSQFATFAATAAKRYEATGVVNWEIWNEPNLEGFWQPAPDATAYTQLLQASYNAIKGVAPNDLVLSGSVGPLDDSPASIRQLTFVSRMYASGAKPYFNALGYHPYSYPAPPDYTISWNSWSMMAALPSSARSIMLANGDDAKQIWVTEYGAPTNGPGAQANLANYAIISSSDHTSEALQATMLAQATTDYLTDNWMAAFFWYSYKDLGSSPSTNENFFGLVRSSGAHKPADDTLRAIIAAQK